MYKNVFVHVINVNEVLNNAALHCMRKPTKRFFKDSSQKKETKTKWAFKQNCGVNRSFHSHTLQQDELSVPVCDELEASECFSLQQRLWLKPAEMKDRVCEVVSRSLCDSKAPFHCHLYLDHEVPAATERKQEFTALHFCFRVSCTNNGIVEFSAQGTFL